MKTNLSRFAVIVFCATAFANSHSLFAAESSAARPYVIGIAQEFESLHPMTANAQATVYVSSLVLRPLVLRNTEGQVIPELAVSVPSLKNGGAKFITEGNKKTIQAIWLIRDDASWSDGSPVVCADFQLARDIANSPNVSVSSKETYTQIAKVLWTPEKPKTCTFIYDKARWDFAELTALVPMPSHLEKAVFEKYDGQQAGYERNSLYNRSPLTPGLYNGPYMASEVKLGSHVAVVPNPYYKITKPQLPGVIVKLIPDTNSLVANLQSGTLDATSSMGLTFDQALSFEKKIAAEKLPFKMNYRASAAYERIDFNLDNPMLKDVRVRQALLYAINREELSQSLYAGKQPAAIHFISPNYPWNTKDPKFVHFYSYDRRKANQLLDEAGWKINPKDGIRTKDGQRLSFQFMTTSGNQNRETLQTYLMGFWKNIGVEIQVKNEPARVLFGDTMPRRKFTALVMAADSDDGDLRPSFHSSQIPSEKNGWSGSNFKGWSNAKVDELIEKMETEFDAKKQAAMAHQVIEIYTREVPSIPLFYRTVNVVTPIKLKNFVLSGDSNETKMAEKWSL